MVVVAELHMFSYVGTVSQAVPAIVSQEVRRHKRLIWDMKELLNNYWVKLKSRGITIL